MNFDQIISNILKLEGGYVNDTSDRGGETNYGITVSVARENGYTGAMSAMSESFARAVYLSKYIVKPGFDKVGSLSEPVATKLIDIGVNMGTMIASQFLQRALNLFNNSGAAWNDISVDGQIGPASLTALQRYIQVRQAEANPVMVKMLGILQGARYVEIAESNPSQEKFIYGWIKNRV